jgi:hypothetical protein
MLNPCKHMRIRFSFLALIFGLLLAGSAAAGNGQQGATPGTGPRLLNGPTILDRLERMSPQQRRRVLEGLPPWRRQRLEARLARWESLPPEERERLRRQYDRFRALPLERQQAARSLFQEFASLPPARRRALRQEARRLSQMDDASRQARTASRDFRDRYSPEERQILRALAEVAPGP